MIMKRKRINESREGGEGRILVKKRIGGNKEEEGIKMEGLVAGEGQEG